MNELIESAYARDFTKGHLEGAVNIPVDANERERCEALRGIDKKACIVVYCQSSACLFAEKVALKLKSDGFTNVSLFKDGWIKWKKKN